MDEKLSLISPEIIPEFVNFEKENEFISKELNLNSLAKKINTNASYLSKVINHHKKSSFSQYLSDLRISYTLDQLKQNPTYRKYTVKAIAQEVGFKTAESFSKAFQKQTGLKPSYFIKELEKTLS